jgi:hypothetical protein
MRCSWRIIANLGSRELDVISALVRASASTSDGDLSRLFIESEALKLSRVGRHTPYAESALYLARRSTRRFFRAS